MSANVYEAEPMKVDDEEFLFVLSLKWIKCDDEPQKLKKLETSLVKMLQSWFNKQKAKVDCSVKRTLKDGRVVVKTKPAPALTDLQKLSRQTLTGRDGNSVTITSINLTLPSLELDTQVPEDASMKLSASLQELQTEQVLQGEQSNTPREEVHSCSVPVGHFWYVNHMYEEEIKRIEKKNGVQIKAEVKVRFEVDQKHGSPDNALSEFANLVQKSLVESSGSVIPLKFIEPDQWSNALKTIQKKESKLLVAMTSDVMTVRGPRHSQDVISKCLYADAMQTSTAYGSLDPYLNQLQLGKQSSTVSAGEEMYTCSVPVGHFWYVNHMYEEEMKRIEKNNGVKIMADVKVRFEVDQKHGSPDNALREFATLVQKNLVESSGSVIPLKFIESDQWGDALKTIQRKDNKLLVTLTSEVMTVRGPGQSQEAIRRSLNADTHQKRNTDASHERDTSLKIDMTTNNPFPQAGSLIIEKTFWKLMIVCYNKEIERIKAKFNVLFKELDIGQGKVNVKAVYKKDEGNASMESHAVRELLYLYQKTATSPMKFNTATKMSLSCPWR